VKRFADRSQPRLPPFRPGTYRSRLHDDARIATVLGIALGIAFTLCFATGLVSHLIQHPPSWFSWPPRPAWLYRVTQGVHVATGIAAIPLLLAKLWAVSPRLWVWPPARDLGHAVERAGLVPLVAGSLFLSFTGIGSINRLRPWGFSFPAAHYAAAWIAIGALVMHVGAKLHVAARALSRGGAPASPADDGVSRRSFLLASFAAAGAVTLATLGQTVRPLRRVSVLAPRDPAVGPQGVPINRTARSAGVVDAATSPDYRLRVSGHGLDARSLALADLRAMPQREADLAITCVDGWSASARWRGVSVVGLLEAVGAPRGSRVEIRSLQAPGSAYATSILEPDQAMDEDTLLALDLNGQPLALDHGFPVRLIAPNRPGVLQTKWVGEVVVT
jgi:DMSO/TMAO reductase YedYZ molybdopterin-dependent catalytic subunit